MNTLGISDIATLYNLAKREMIADRMKDKRQSVSVMNQTGSGMTREEVDKFAEQCDKLLYLALSRLKLKYYGQKDDNHTWIGINPEGKTMQQLWDLTNALGGRYSWVPPHEDLAFCVEQNTSQGVRPHIHLMLRGIVSQKPSYIAKRLSEYYDCPNNFIDVKHFRKKVMYQEHEKYIKGDKKTEKQELVNQDNVDRQDLGIPQYKPFN